MPIPALLWAWPAAAASGIRSTCWRGWSCPAWPTSEGGGAAAVPCRLARRGRADPRRPVASASAWPVRPGDCRGCRPIPAPLAWGGLLMPLLWTAASYGLMGVVNPLLQERVDWPWFIVSQFVFGVAAAIVVRPLGEGLHPARRPRPGPAWPTSWPAKGEVGRESSHSAMRTMAAAPDRSWLVLAAGCDLPGKPRAGGPARCRRTRSWRFDALYRQNCAGCHGADGKLGPAPPLNDPSFSAIVPDADGAARHLRGGRARRCPPCPEEHGGPLTPAPGGGAADRRSRDPKVLAGRDQAKRVVATRAAAPAESPTSRRRTLSPAGAKGGGPETPAGPRRVRPRLRRLPRRQGTGRRRTAGRSAPSTTRRSWR